ncbi:MAG: hypothetical protein N2202_00925 [Proteobacteria bacterium]|nr:hypothetical protein [Pseudomonadota bacterium]
MIKVKKSFRFLFIFFFLFIIVLFCDVYIYDNYLGFFILKKNYGIGFEIKNDIYPDDVKNIIVAFDLENFLDHVGVNKLFSSLYDYPRLDFVWDENNGRGVVKNFLSEDKKIYVTFSRFKDDNGFVPKGLFVGGGLPKDFMSDIPESLNDTGMAYYDGKSWYHIWCSANEGISTGNDYSLRIPPSIWNFKGSKIIKISDKDLILKSLHEVNINNSTLRIDRYAFFKAGEPYFVLVTKFKNIGKEPIDFIYVYGDEPWIGEYGSSAGDVGWIKDGLVFHEGAIDINKYNYLGFYDVGNEWAGEKFGYTGLANFIEWLDEESKPDLAYFSNEVGKFSIDKLVPLNSKNNRNLSIEWGPKRLLPKGEFVLSLAIGMVVDYDMIRPIKPEIKITKKQIENSSY